VAVGGDGHIRSVASGVLTVPGAVMGVAAAGRGNDLIRHLGVPSDPEGIARTLLADRRRGIDVLDVALPGGESTIAVGNVYAGIDSVATELINELRWMGRVAYRVAPFLTALRWKPMHITMTVDGRRRELPAHMVVIANSGDYGHGMRMVPSASVDSGRIEVLIVHGDRSHLRLANLISQAKSGAHVDRPEVEVLSGTSVELSVDRPVPVHADGDYIGELPVSVTLRPAVLPIVG
ncbi:MAG: diacylglycerol kinase family protein, partial [Gordonia sp. (in: high G+C Gram-positive bacteria)]